MATIKLWFGRQNFHLSKSFLLLKIIAVVFAVLLFCEFLIYYLVIFRCNWPEVKIRGYDSERETLEPVLKAMFLADTHLLGKVRGHWLDKLRREWQMERAFQTALWLLQPEVVFILGDIFDEGKWSSSQAWADDVERFHKMFRHPHHVQLKVVAGNHDIGFHYQMSTYRIKRFEKVFNRERLFSWKGINFVMVNSVALEGDGCNICSEAEAELIKISHKLNCSREVGDHFSWHRCLPFWHFSRAQHIAPASVGMVSCCRRQPPSFCSIFHFTGEVMPTVLGKMPHLQKKGEFPLRRDMTCFLRRPHRRFGSVLEANQKTGDGGQGFGSISGFKVIVLFFPCPQ
ncbi:metallophosphoesterase 1 isoform X4 [Rousettus aegyptiacus]|uniref:metallophosphoesterase 1 isoform X4 n=1 Tax=Rousettus aegyptiacus TaxID=9407 RepID=UPI00078817BC|nr:metallophosphoesterase 1 isoform X4 [Rousettus aegyptiacus]